MRIKLRRQIPRWGVALQRPARFKGAKGGRSSGKSHFMAEEFVERMVRRPNARMVCIREVQRSLKFSAKSLIEAKIEEMGVSSHFSVLATEIRSKYGNGVVIFEGMQDHTVDSIKSLEGFEVAWVEEAQSISQRSLDMLIPTIRADGSELWFSWNPHRKTDPVEVLFAELTEDFLLVHTTYRDNPFCPDVMRKEAARLKALDPDAYDHIWDGAFFLGGGGRMYTRFVDKPFPIGNVDESVSDTGAELLVGQDFNVNPMSVVIAVRVGDECHVIDALEIDSSDTQEVANELRTRYPGRTIIMCPDASGRARHSSAPVGQTDFTILERAGFEVRAPLANPLVVDRINNVQEMCFDGERRRLRVHPRAESYITAMSMQTYKKDTSQPDKKSGYDHLTDAGGYLLWQEFNVLEEQASVGFSSISL